MNLFHRHKWKVDAQKSIEVERSLFGGKWYTTLEIARVDKCEKCGVVRGWLISAVRYQPASVPWLREMMKDD